MKFATLIALALLTNTTLAEPVGDLAHGKPVCFERQYSAQHMQTHPQQTVRDIQMTLFRQANPRDKTIYMNLKLNVAGKPYETFMLCDSVNGGLSCAVECDGGHAEIQFTDTKDLHFINKRFVVYGGCEGDEEPKWMEPTANGDDAFDLTTSSAPCTVK
jgi:hypothetical protein